MAWNLSSIYLRYSSASPADLIQGSPRESLSYQALLLIFIATSLSLSIFYALLQTRVQLSQLHSNSVYTGRQLDLYQRSALRPQFQSTLVVPLVVKTRSITDFRPLPRYITIPSGRATSILYLLVSPSNISTITQYILLPLLFYQGQQRLKSLRRIYSPSLFKASAIREIIIRPSFNLYVIREGL